MPFCVTKYLMYMIYLKKNCFFSLVTCFILLFNFQNLKSDEKINAIVDQIQVITKDLKTLEKAVYKESDITSLSNISNDTINEDVLTKHLLKLNDIENQFRELTNKFEEINFKMDKLNSRVTKIQSDNQMRFSDLESGKINNKKPEKTIKAK